MNKVGILTFHTSYNRGALLQAYALTETINDLGVDAELIDYHPVCAFDSIDLKSKIKGRSFVGGLKAVVRHFIDQRMIRAMDRFRKHFLKISREAYHAENIGAANLVYDIIITGSDQVLNTDITRSDRGQYLLEWVSDRRKKCSYAMSCRQKDIVLKNVDFFLEALTPFERLSVRERSLGVVVERLTGKNVDTHMDPVFLFERQKWEDLCNEKACLGYKYVFLYSIRGEENSRTLIELGGKLAKQNGLKLVIPFFANRLTKNREIPLKIKMGDPLSFVNLIRNAEYVITDSFHGLAFSIIFNKNFVVAARESEGGGERLDNLLQLAGLENRCFQIGGSSNIPMLDKPCFQGCNEALVREREKAKEYLRDLCCS